MNISPKGVKFLSFVTGTGPCYLFHKDFVEFELVDSLCSFVLSPIWQLAVVGYPGALSLDR